MVKNLPSLVGDACNTNLIAQLGRSLGGGNGSPLSVLAWRIPGTGKPGGLLSMGLHRVGHD